MPLAHGLKANVPAVLAANSRGVPLPSRRAVFAAGAACSWLPEIAQASDEDDDKGPDWLRSSGADGAWTEHEGTFDEAFFSDFTSAANGFKYKFVAPGEGPKPQRGAAYNEGYQKVALHYTGYLLDGRKFDSSYGREPFAFRMGKGKVIPGWEAVVGGMTKGQKVIVLIPPQYAYGPAGKGIIPSNAPLVYYLELRRLGSIK